MTFPKQTQMNFHSSDPSINLVDLFFNDFTKNSYYRRPHLSKLQLNKNGVLSVITRMSLDLPSELTAMCVSY